MNTDKQYVWLVTYDYGNGYQNYAFSTEEKAKNWVFDQICEHIKQNPNDFTPLEVVFCAQIENLYEVLSRWYERVKSYASETYEIESVPIDEFD